MTRYRNEAQRFFDKMVRHGILHMYYVIWHMVIWGLFTLSLHTAVAIPIKNKASSVVANIPLFLNIRWFPYENPKLT